MAFEYTTLGEYAKVQGGFAYKSKDFEASGEHRVLKIKNVRFGVVSYEECAFIADEIAHATEAWKTKEGDILISMTGSGPNAPQSLVGRVARVWKNEPEAFINQRVGRLQLKQDGSIHLDYLFYLLSLPSSQHFLVANSSGSANQANISGKIIELLPCPRISFKYSKRIAEIGLALDEKILLNQQTNKTLEQMAQALFKSWFVDFDPVIDNALAAGNPIPDELVHRVEVRKKAHALPDFQPLPEHIRNLFPSEFEQTGDVTFGIEGWMPKGWEYKKFKEVIDKYIDNRGKTPPLSKEGYPLVEVKNLPANSNFPLTNSEKRVDEKTFRSWFRQYVREKDILISTVGTIGRCSFVKDVDIGVAQNVLGLRFGKLATPEFMFYTIKGHKFQHDVDSRLVITVQASIKRKDLNTIDILLPNISIQNKFSEIVDGYLAAQYCRALQNQTLEANRDALLPKLISGEIELDSAGKSSAKQEGELQGV